MLSRMLAFILLAFSVLSVCCEAQDVLQVTAREIQQHADHKSFPVYPAIAKAAGVQGTVVFDLQIGKSGKIESMKVVSGPPMLQQAAIDCVKQWTFHPFMKAGAAVAARGQYSLIFTLASDSAATNGQTPPSSTDQGSRTKAPQVITVPVKSWTQVQGVDTATEQQFNDADGACKDGVLSHQFNDATVSSCKRAAEFADGFPMENNYITKRSTFVHAATAYGDLGDFQNALIWANKAVAVVELGHDGDSGSEAAYSTRGEVEGLSGDLTAADRDLTKGEELARKALPNRTATLVRDLRFHAQVLQKLNRGDEAQKKLDEAAKYE